MLYNSTGHTSFPMPSTLLTNRTSVEKGPEASGTIDSNRSNSDITTMVSGSAKNGHTGSMDTSDIGQPLTNPLINATLKLERGSSQERTNKKRDIIHGCFPYHPS